MTSSSVRSARHGTGTGNGNNSGTHQHQQMGSASYGYRERPGSGENSHRGHEDDHDMGLGDDQQDVELDDQVDADVDSSDSSLIAQTLNADGTPKRPMNAFMIFARRRRPQVSAANQMMRTGEISKILSREWSGMPMSEKQFYLDQAKKLKDAFNVKYPDYVYRRRPNNSRRRRRADSASSQGPGILRPAGSTGPLSVSDQSEQDLDIHERDEHASFDSGSPVDYRPGGPTSAGALGHLGYSDIVVHPATTPGAGSATHPALSLSGLPSLGPLGSGPTPGAGGGGLAPPSAYPRAPFTPLSASTSSGTGTSAAGGGSDHQPVSPLSPYGRYSPYSPVTPATSASSGFPPVSGSYGQGSSMHASYPDSEFGHSTNGAGAGSAGHAARLTTLDWPNEPQHHQQPHSAFPHSPGDPSPHANLWGSRSASASGPGTGSVPASWPLSNLPPAGLPPPGGQGSARTRIGSAGGLGLNLSLGTSSGSALGQGQGQGQGVQNQTQGRPKEYKDLFNNPLPPPSGLAGSSGAASGIRRERAWSTTPSNSSASPSAGGSSGAQFPTLTEPFHPGGHHNRAGSSSGSSPSVGFARSAGGPGDLADIYDAPQSQPNSAYPISPVSPYTHSQHSSQSQNHSQGLGRPTLLQPIATFGSGGGNVSPRDLSPLSAVSPHPSVAHSGGGYWNERLSDR